MVKLTDAQKKLIRASYVTGVIVAAISFFIKKEFGLGVLLGVTAGLFNFIFLERQLENFTSNKRLYFILAGYIARYFLLGVIFYICIKQNMVLFFGVLAGFFIAQALFFKAKIKNS